MFNHVTKNEMLIRERNRVNKLEVEQTNATAPLSIVFVALAEKGNIDAVTATEHAELFADWQSGVKYTKNAIRKYNGLLYKCVQAHTSQDDWSPDVSASLWSEIGDPAEEFPSWAQPIGAHDAYITGDKVTHNGKKWVSTVDANVWQPSVYGWAEYVEETTETPVDEGEQ